MTARCAGMVEVFLNTLDGVAALEQHMRICVPQSVRMKLLAFQCDSGDTDFEVSAMVGNGVVLQREVRLVLHLD